MTLMVDVMFALMLAGRSTRRVRRAAKRDVLARQRCVGAHQSLRHPR